jgi:hypothetical protein
MVRWAFPAGQRAARGGGGDFETVLGRACLQGTSLGKARGGSDTEAALVRGGAAPACARERVRGRFLFGVPCSNMIFSKILNKS